MLVDYGHSTQHAAATYRAYNIMECKWVFLHGLSLIPCVCLSVYTVTKRLIASGCRLEWSRGIGRGIRVKLLDGMEIVEREGTVVVVNVGHPIVTNGIICVMGGSSQITLGLFVVSALYFIFIVLLQIKMLIVRLNFEGFSFTRHGPTSRYAAPPSLLSR